MLTSLAVSLALTLILEGLLALLWGVKDRWDWLLLLLVNVVTNPSWSACTTCWEAGSPSLSGWSSLRWYLSGWAYREVGAGHPPGLLILLVRQRLLLLRGVLLNALIWMVL